MRDDAADAACLRRAAWILHKRARQPQTFVLRVIIRVLQRTADRIEHPSSGDA
jgi:hypothetical protein